MAKETFGQRLAALRKEKGLTQNDIADKVGITAFKQCQNGKMIKLPLISIFS